MHVRELPPLRLHLTAETPSGRKYRWGGDERRAENVPTGTRFSSTAPGGHERLDTTLARKPGVDYGDLERLTTLRAIGAGGAVAWEGRLERAPRTSGDQMAVTPSAVGWQAHLDDDKSARMIYRDADLSTWGDSSRQRRANLLGLGRRLDGGQSVIGDETTGIPTVELSIDRLVSTAANPQRVETWYSASGVGIGSIYYDYATFGVGAGDTDWTCQMALSTDDVATSFNAGTNHTGTAATATLTATVSAKFATWTMEYAGTITADGRWRNWLRRIAVYGTHGLTKRGSEPNAGFYASDIVTHAVQTWAPLLTVSSNTVQTSSFVIPHILFRDATTTSEIVKEATRYGLQDWFVWDGPTFWWHDRGAYGRSWRARVGPAQLEETGPAVDRIWESVIVQYQDVDGSTRTVGPPGSGADTEDSTLKDSDPDNPANQLGIIRRDLLQMGVGTAASATELGRRFLEETKLLDSSGRARIVGHVQDDRGVLHPYWRVRAGDTITFVDSSDTSARRIVRAEHDVDSMTCSIDLDAPPDALPALLARLGVVLIPLGL